MVLARRLGTTSGENDFQFVIVAYRKEAYLAEPAAAKTTPQQNVVAAERIDNVTVRDVTGEDFSELRLPMGSMDDVKSATIQRGSAVILLDDAGCRLARVARVPDEQPLRHVYLDRSIPQKEYDAWFIVEQNTLGSPTNPDELYPGRRSPTLNVLVARSAMRKTEP